MEHLVSRSRVAEEWFARYRAYGGYIKSDKEGRAYERELIARAQAGDEAARVELITANVPIIMSKVKQFTKTNISADDRIQVALIGFSKGISKYDLDNPLQARLGFYALLWAHQALQEQTAQSCPVHVPYNVMTALAQFRKSGLSEPRDVSYAPTHAVRAAAMAEQRVSIDAPPKVNGDERSDGTILDTMRDESVDDAREEAENAEQAAHDARIVREAMARCLTPREIQIIECHVAGMTLEQIGASIGITREAVRQIEVKCIKRIKNALKGRPRSYEVAQRIQREGKGGVVRGEKARRRAMLEVAA